ncbi:MAG: hypothetical protein AAF677_00915 [Pseudomonadota bacterium]
MQHLPAARAALILAGLGLIAVPAWRLGRHYGWRAERPGGWAMVGKALFNPLGLLLALPPIVRRLAGLAVLAAAGLMLHDHLRGEVRGLRLGYAPPPPVSVAEAATAPATAWGEIVVHAALGLSAAVSDTLPRQRRLTGPRGSYRRLIPLWPVGGETGGPAPAVLVIERPGTGSATPPPLVPEVTARHGRAARGPVVTLSVLRRAPTLGRGKELAAEIQEAFAAEPGIVAPAPTVLEQPADGMAGRRGPQALSWLVPIATLLGAALAGHGYAGTRRARLQREARTGGTAGG